MLGLECGLPGLADLLEAQGDMMNVPPVGSSTNRCFSAMQLNVTHPIPVTSGNLFSPCTTLIQYLRV